jgi:translation initiation factor 2 subunit 1
MILLSELSRRRIRSIHSLLRVGNIEAVMVIRTDKEKGYIDLSKRRVSPEDIEKTEDRYNKAKAVHSILRYFSTLSNVSLATLYEKCGWPLYRKYGHAYDGFQKATIDPEPVLRDIDLSEDIKRRLVEYIRTKLTPQPFRVRADIQLTCFAYEGIEAIRSALVAVQSLSTTLVPIRVQLIAAPLYVMQTTTIDKNAGIASLTKAIELVKTIIESKGGNLIVKMAPNVTTTQDMDDLTKRFAEVEVPSDEEEDNDDTMGDVDFDAINNNMDSGYIATNNGTNSNIGSSASSSSSSSSRNTPTTTSSTATASNTTTTAAEEDVVGTLDLGKKKKAKGKVSNIKEED